MKEFARVLKPGGSLGLIWNFYDQSRWPEFQERIFVPINYDWAYLQKESWSHDKDTPTYGSMEWLKAFDSDVVKELYILPLQKWEHKWVRKLDEPGMWDFIRSLSFINRLTPEEKLVKLQSMYTDDWS